MGDKSGTSIAVVGASIGGMSAALNLLRAGFDVQVYEQARALREVGAGINVTPNATRIIHDLGLGEKLDNLGVIPLAVRQLRWDDRRTLLHTPLGREIEAHFGFPQYRSHRADVLNMLVTALPAERMHVGHRLIGFTERGDTVEAQFENGARVAVDALIGADGIHSTVQRELFGAAKPRFTGCAAYRGLVPADKLKHLKFEVTLELSLGPDKHFVRYFVASGRYVNFVAIIEQDSWTKESWTDRGDVNEARAAFDGWHKGVSGLLETVDETFIWGLFDRAPLDRWSVGRVTLLGDACHPMLPFVAQGAAQAMEDGVTLTACLQKFDDIPEALARYQALRLPRTAHVQSLAAANKSRFHLHDGPEQIARDEKMAAGGTDWSFKAMEWIYSHDPAAAAETGNLGLPPTA